MARVFEQLNFYDIFGYLIPGAVVVGCALLLVDATFPDTTSDLGGVSGVELTGLLFLAYLVGHIVQAVARRIEPPLNAIMWGGWPSEALLRPDDKRFTTEFKIALRKLVADRYAIPDKASAGDVFAICYSYVIQNGIRRRVEAFLGLSGLSRGWWSPAPSLRCSWRAAQGPTSFMDSLPRTSRFTPVALQRRLWRR
jgi:hypothetical protein